MDEKRFYCDDFGEYRSYAIYDCSKVDKTKEDFWDNVEEVYDIIAYEEYLEENDCMLISNEAVDLLNELYEDNRQLKKLLQEAEEEINKLKKSNKQWMESLVNMESED